MGDSLGEYNVHLVNELFTWWFSWKWTRGLLVISKQLFIYLLFFKLHISIYLLYLKSILFSAKEPYDFSFVRALDEY